MGRSLIVTLNRAAVTGHRRRTEPGRRVNRLACARPSGQIGRMSPCRLMLGRGMYAVTFHDVSGTSPVTHECSERTAEAAARRFAALHPAATAVVAENLLNPDDSFRLA